MRNFKLYSDPLGLTTMLDIFGRRDGASTLKGLWGEFRGFRISFWGLFGVVNVRYGQRGSIKSWMVSCWLWSPAWPAGATALARSPPARLAGLCALGKLDSHCTDSAVALDHRHQSLARAPDFSSDLSD